MAKDPGANEADSKSSELVVRSGTRLGAHWDGDGVVFTLRSHGASAVELCLFEPASGTDAGHESTRLALEPMAAGLWRRRVAGIGPGQLYGYRVDGPYRPSAGLRFNPRKLLVDPWARAVAGELRFHEAVLGYRPDQGAEAAAPSDLDSAPFVPKSVVVADDFAWQGDTAPRIPWCDTVIYECHVKGMTRLHPDVPAELRGTYLGLIQEPVLAHLRSLGITAVELLPLAHFASERRLDSAGLTNYWGYNPLAFFAPHAAYASGSLGQQVVELKTMVRELHRAGLEVILDVVYNHTAEGDELGPTLSLRGLDNARYYRLRPGDPSRYEDFSGCGNTLDAAEPAALDLILSSLRYWVEEMHVDGFRVDLAPVLARGPQGFDPFAPFLRELERDPVLAQVKLIAEPWDLGRGGHCLGGFPEIFSEWNDRYRDAVRRFWRSDAASAAELATRLAGSSDLFGGRRRGPCASINYVACHDGFTLEDLVSYEHKVNWANHEGNRDGSDHDLSRNWGVEGPTAREDVLRQRALVKRSLLATLALSLGVPMLGHGDELGRSQRGNNNAYCQDNEMSWLNWDLDDRQRHLLDFTCRLLELRRRTQRLRSGSFLKPAEVTWLGPRNEEMTPELWRQPGNHVLGLLVQPVPVAVSGELSGWLMALFNGGGRARLFTLPQVQSEARWRKLLDTTSGEVTLEHPSPLRHARVRLAPHSVMLLACDKT